MTLWFKIPFLRRFYLFTCVNICSAADFTVAKFVVGRYSEGILLSTLQPGQLTPVTCRVTNCSCFSCAQGGTYKVVKHIFTLFPGNNGCARLALKVHVHTQWSTGT